MTQRKLLPITAALLVFGLSACSIMEENKVDYRSARKGETLEVPPDLTALSRNDRYAVNTDGTINASAYQNTNQVAQNMPTAADTVADVRIERSGNKRWLVVNRSADKLWPVVTGFWKDNGFNLEVIQEALGIMETDWAENRAKLPQDFIRESLGKLFPNLYSTSERDRFRTRLERNGDSTEIYVTHRGLVEKLVSKSGGTSGDATIWEPRASDNELEAEFLRRMMLKLGVSETQAKAALAQESKAPAVAQIQGDALEINEGFDSAWRKVGLALDRSNFTVADRDRSKGIYFVRYAPPSKEEKDGFFSKIFGGSAKDNASPQEYRVIVSTIAADKSRASVQSPTGTIDANARSILKIMAEDLQ